MDAISLLKKDHYKVKKVMQQLAKTTERGVATRKKLFKVLKSELDLHTKVEEELFYPLLKEYKLTRSMAFESYEEHAIVDHLLKQLAEDEMKSEEWTAKFTVLKENVEHHVKEEEKDLFPKAKKTLGLAKLKELGKEIEVFKKTNNE